MSRSTAGQVPRKRSVSPPSPAARRLSIAGAPVGRRTAGGRPAAPPRALREPQAGRPHHADQRDRWRIEPAALASRPRPGRRGPGAGPARAGLHRHGTGSALGRGHHRVRHRRGPPLPGGDHGPLLAPDRRVVHRAPPARRARRRRPRHGHRPATARRRGRRGSRRPRQPGRIQPIVATPRPGGVQWSVDSRQQTERSARSCGRLVIRSSSGTSRWRSGSTSPKACCRSRRPPWLACRSPSGNGGSTTLAACRRST